VKRSRGSEKAEDITFYGKEGGVPIGVATRGRERPWEKNFQKRVRQPFYLSSKKTVGGKGWRESKRGRPGRGQELGRWRARRVEERGSEFGSPEGNVDPAGSRGRFRRLAKKK